MIDDGGKLKNLTAACAKGNTVTEISLNNARTYIWMDGLLWTDTDGGSSGYFIPKGSGKGFQNRFSREMRAFSKNRKVRIYVVRKGDNLSAIACQRRMTGKNHGFPLYSGMVLN